MGRDAKRLDAKHDSRFTGSDGERSRVMIGTYVLWNISEHEWHLKYSFTIQLHNRIGVKMNEPVKKNILENGYILFFLLLIITVFFLALIIPFVDVNDPIKKVFAISVIGIIFTGIGWCYSFFTNKYFKDREYALETLKLSSARSDLRQQMITNNIAPMRQSWINDLRDKSSLFFHKSDLNSNKLASYYKNCKKLKDANRSDEEIRAMTKDSLSDIQEN